MKPSVHPFQLPVLNDFVEFLYFTDIFKADELETINNYWDQEQIEKAGLEGEIEYEDSLRKSSVMGINAEEEYQWLFDRLTMLVHHANGQRYGFTVNGFYEPLQLAEYGEGDFFDWHLDFGPGAASNRKFSITIQLSDEEAYEGGDLQFQINNKFIDAPRKKGTVVLFPSFVIHRVTPITKETRRSLVGWVSGPPFR